VLPRAQSWGSAPQAEQRGLRGRSGTADLCHAALTAPAVLCARRSPARLGLLRLRGHPAPCACSAEEGTSSGSLFTFFPAELSTFHPVRRSTLAQCQQFLVSSHSAPRISFFLSAQSLWSQAGTAALALPCSPSMPALPPPALFPRT